MPLELLMRSLVNELRCRDVKFALAGGLAASLYRDQPRLTNDVDVGILAESHELEMAENIIESIGLESRPVREAELAGGPSFAIRDQSTPVCIVVGRPAGNPAGEGVDILLPSLPWIIDAIGRGQSNAVDYGFGPVPTITVEDFIIAKLFALRAIPIRAKDLDDLQSVLAADHSIDIPYLAGQMRKFHTVIPRQARPFLPENILKIGQDVARMEKRAGKLR